MTTTPDYIVRQSSELFTREYRLYLSKADKLVSPWHDIPLFHDEQQHIMNMVVEVPRWENVKLEIAKDEFLTPLRQHIIDDSLQFIPNIFPHKGYPWNYGCFPQTWEEPSYIDPSSTYPGDGDPLDVCELAGDVAQAGQVKQVKALGAFAVIEDQKADWKVVVVDVGNPLAEKMTNINDVDKHLPGYLDTMLEWFRVYRMAEGKVKNAIGGDDGRDETRVIKGREFAHSLIERCHKSWKKVLTEPTMETKVSMADVRIRDNHLAQQIPTRPRDDSGQLAKVDTSVANKSHYISPNWPTTVECEPWTLEV